MSMVVAGYASAARISATDPENAAVAPPQSPREVVRLKTPVKGA
jgi:uncharacterized protein (UPF0264 family)